MSWEAWWSQTRGRDRNQARPPRRLGHLIHRLAGQPDDRGQVAAGGFVALTLAQHSLKRGDVLATIRGGHDVGRGSSLNRPHQERQPLSTCLVYGRSGPSRSRRYVSSGSSRKRFAQFIADLLLTDASGRSDARQPIEIAPSRASSTSSIVSSGAASGDHSLGFKPGTFGVVVMGGS
jgi:hypothetical protein